MEGSTQLEPPDLGALIAKVLPPRANHAAAAAQVAASTPITFSNLSKQRRNVMTPNGLGLDTANKTKDSTSSLRARWSSW